MRTSRRHTEAGMTLVEILLALGLMASVLISVASLFILGGQRVKGSRNMTQGMAIASDVMEDLYNFGMNVMPTTFDDCCPGGCATSTGCTVSSASDGFLQKRWLPAIEEKLGQGRLEITLVPVGGSVTPPTFSTAEGLRLRVEVFWSEGVSERSVYEETVLF
ncbi:MAG: type II secretion system protein [Acidobacteria bacterium]|nr:type II secretion system protein [Acidobacteriota bacterium]